MKFLFASLFINVTSFRIFIY